jgi:ketosteroid isomerase-like protein
MSENLDLVRSIYAAWERGDFSSAVWAHPEIEFALADGPDPGTWTGMPGTAEGYRTWLSAWTNFRAEPEEYLVLDDERILVLVHNTGRGRTSGLSLDERSAANLFQLENGKVTRVVVYLDRERARADLGLEEPDLA